MNVPIGRCLVAAACLFAGASADSQTGTQVPRPLQLCAATANRPCVEPNQVYGQYSGAALLMAVFRPAKPNGFGIVLIPGSAWNASLHYGSAGLQQSPATLTVVPLLVEAGYTVFVLEHRRTPAFRYPAPLEDVQRAVRFIRYNARRFGIDPARLGGSGSSSGGHLISLLGVLDGTGDPNNDDPVERESSKLQCVVAIAPPVDLTAMRPSVGEWAVTLLLGAHLDERTSKNAPEYKLAQLASPIRYVSRDDAPTLLIHGDADRTVPFHQSEMMEAALKAVGVRARLVRIEGGEHGVTAVGMKYSNDIVGWFDAQLRQNGAVK